MMLAMQIRPSVKFIMLGYALCVLAEIAAGVVVYGVEKPANPEDYMLAISVVILILAFFLAVRHIQRRVTKITILTDRLRYESGMFSKTTRTVELAKVQDVRVDQTLGQRIMNMGNISLETAGSSSRLVMNSIDSPQVAADHILELAHKAGKQPL
jgi:membrane protein YdbS with pleckstrin-like domain